MSRTGTRASKDNGGLALGKHLWNRPQPAYSAGVSTSDTSERLKMSLATSTMNGPGHFLNWGWFSISAGNLVVVLAGIALFLGALWLPFPGDHQSRER